MLCENELYHSPKIISKAYWKRYEDCVVRLLLSSRTCTLVFACMYTTWNEDAVYWNTQRASLNYVRFFARMLWCCLNYLDTPKQTVKVFLLLGFQILIGSSYGGCLWWHVNINLECLVSVRNRRIDHPLTTLVLIMLFFAEWTATRRARGQTTKLRTPDDGAVRSLIPL